MPYKNWIFEKDGKIGIIRMNRPEVRNALNWETWMELEDILKRLHEEPDLRVGIITGVGDEAFIAGADLHMLKDRTPQDAINASKKANEILLFMESMKEPFIAAINGWALGGVARSPWHATSGSPARRPSSARQRSAWGSCPDTEEMSGSCGSSVRDGPKR